MTKEELVKKAYEINSDDEKSLLISSFSDKQDAFIVAVICAWVSNDIYPNSEYYMAKHIVNEIMCGKPKKYIDNYTYLDNVDPRIRENKNLSMFNILTLKNFDNLCLSLKIKREVQTTKLKFAHEIFFDFFGSGCGFPTIRTNSTFYRYNLLLYWLTYKLHIQEYTFKPTTKIILPCNDRILDNAYKLKVFRKKMRHNTLSALKLTQIAKNWFGEEYYKMFELLQFYNA